MQGLELPASLNQRICQPFEQGWMGGRAPFHAKIISILHQAFAEMILPNPVGHDARGQRGLRPGDPVREGPPPTRRMARGPGFR